MFSLLVSIASIALVAALLLASLFYGGKIITEARVRVSVAHLMADVQQLQGAVHLFRSQNNRLPESLNELLADREYLTSTPSNAWFDVDAFIQTGPQQVEANVCYAFNEKRGIPLIPACNDEEYLNVVVCCQDFESEPEEGESP